MDELSERFFNGMKALGVPKKDLLDGKWRHCGGRDKDGVITRYFHLFWKGKEIPPIPKHKDQCVCKQRIHINMFITDDKRIIVVGSDCIKKFTKDGLRRTCDDCGVVHKNRLVNKCNDCRNDGKYYTPTHKKRRQYKVPELYRQINRAKQEMSDDSDSESESDDEMTSEIKWIIKKLGLER